MGVEKLILLFGIIVELLEISLEVVFIAQKGDPPLGLLAAVEGFLLAIRPQQVGRQPPRPGRGYEVGEDRTSTHLGEKVSTSEGFSARFRSGEKIFAERKRKAKGVDYGSRFSTEHFMRERERERGGGPK